MHNLLLLISLVENKAVSQPTVNNPDLQLLDFVTLNKSLFYGLKLKCNFIPCLNIDPWPQTPRIKFMSPFKVDTLMKVLQKQQMINQVFQT